MHRFLWDIEINMNLSYRSLELELSTIVDQVVEEKVRK